jgi:DNA-binding transcriptional LysR family regulator
MTLEDLRIFVAACEAGSLSGLARRLGRTQSSVSQHVARLEAELGAALIERSARGIEPTEAGRILWELALQGLDAIALARQRIGALEHGETGTVTITTGGTTVRHFLKSVVVRFRHAHPGVNIRFIPAGSTRRCFELLRLSQADLALVTTGERVSGVNTRTVALQHFFLLVAEGDPLGRYASLRLRDLHGIRYLGLAEGTTHRGLLEQAAAEQGVHLEPEIVFDDFDTASVFVELGLGQAIVPAVQAHNFARSGAVQAVPIEDLPPVPFGWGFRHWKYLSPAARDFVDLFGAELKEMARIPGVSVVDNAPDD